jgi:hypothetical protein
MLARTILFLLFFYPAVNSIGQIQTTAIAKQTASDPVVHHTASVTAPPIKNIAAPKEVNKKKRKPSKVTVAQKSNTQHQSPLK